MKPAHILMALLAATAATLTVVAVGPATATTLTATTTHGLPAAVANACPVAAPGQAECFALRRTDVRGGTGVRGRAAVIAGHPAAATLPPGYSPSDLDSAYHLPTAGGQGQTVAIVDAGDDADAESDLAVYRSTYGLPACTTANGCFHKVNQRGNTSPLPPDQGWGVEISLDLDMVSAACPECHILLVDGDTQDVSDLAASEDTAAALGATEISNSYGETEQNGQQPFDADYDHPGVAILVASGDTSYGPPSYPATLANVVAVGGTSLNRANNARGWTETAWGGTTSGCSAWIAKPSWQHDPNCPGRMDADVAADADPNTGSAVYDSFDGFGWLLGGGTSAASPFLAGVIALGGHPERFGDASYLYSHADALNDVASGNNDSPGTTDCGGDYLCNAVPGYDGPTGNGTPNGLGAF